MSMKAAPQQEVDAVIEAYGGDARAPVRELLANADFLRDQLYIASALVSKATPAAGSLNMSDPDASPARHRHHGRR